MKENELNRRVFFGKGIKSIGSVGLANAIGSSIFAREMCHTTTEPQPEGPFYPIEDQSDKDTDLTAIKGSSKRAKGEKVILSGVVQDDSCLPIPGAVVEIWQACDSGKYNHPGDTNPAQLDPNFQYWGRSITDLKGKFSFKTIKPGKYPAGSGWVRPPHIHVKVLLRGYEELTTQVYFAEEKNLNSRDLILKRLNSDQREKVTLEFVKKEHGLREGNVIFTIKGLN